MKKKRTRPGALEGEKRLTRWGDGNDEGDGNITTTMTSAAQRRARQEGV